MRTAGRYFGGELPPADGRRGTPHEQVQADPEFVALRRRLRGFAFPATAAFLLWYLAFVLLASYARELMATPVLGSVNLGLVIGLAQFATTFALTTAYVVYAGRHLDPRAARVRAQVEARLPALPDPAPTGTAGSRTGPPGTAGSSAAPFDTARSDTAPFDTARSDTAPFDTARSDTAPFETVRFDAVPHGTGRSGAGPFGTARLDPARVDPARSGPAPFGGTRGGGGR